MSHGQRHQVIAPKKVLGEGWTEFEVISRDSTGQTKSRTIVRTKDEAPFLDVAIEEYTGVTRRAKYTSVRLEEEASRRIYEALAIKFAKI